jgi:integrase
LRGHVNYYFTKAGKKLWFYKFTSSTTKKDVWKRGFESKKEAEDALALALAGIVTGEYVSPDMTTLIEYVRTWFSNQVLARTTRAGYRNIIDNHIAKDAIGSMLVSKIQCSTIDNYYAGRRKAGLGENTLRRHRAILRPVLDKAVYDKLLTANPERFVKLKKPRKYKAATFDGEQVATMLKLLRDEEIYPAVLLAVSGTLRRGENLGATWTAFDPERKTLRITQAYYVVDGVADFDPVKNDNSEDFAYLTDFMVSELKRIRKEQLKIKLQLGAAWQDSNLICCRADGSPWNPSTVSKKFPEALARHGLPTIRLHDLRHSHATILHEAGADAKDIADRLRETPQVASDTYIDITAKRKRIIADTFDQAIFGPKNNPRRKRGNQVLNSQ